MGVSTLWNTLPSSVKSVENIAKFCHNLKTYVYTLPIHHVAPWHINQSDDNWNCILTLILINPFVVMHL